MFKSIYRTLLLYIIVVVAIRLMGKRQIGEMQPFEFIVTLIVADLACVPMADVSIPLVYGLVAVFTLFILHQLLSLIERSGDFAKRVIFRVTTPITRFSSRTASFPFSNRPLRGKKELPSPCLS